MVDGDTPDASSRTDRVQVELLPRRSPLSAQYTVSNTADTSDGSAASGVTVEVPVDWSAGHQANISSLFVRSVDWDMDSCCATNKSQFVFEGIGLLVSVGLLEKIKPLFMVPGHTKFGPDLVAWAIAGKYNKSDVLNQNILLQCMQSMQPYKYTILRGFIIGRRRVGSYLTNSQHIEV